MAKAPSKVKRLFAALRAELLAVTGIAERTHYEESAGTFSPAYGYRQAEIVRFHLDPVLAATVTLDPGDRQLAALLQSPAVPEKLRAKLVKSARKSGRRVFLALLVRNAEELQLVSGLLRERVALEG